MRKSCIMCYLKHISQAIVLITESRLGYPNHLWLAVGHLAEAESESIKDFPDLAIMTRNIRIVVMEGNCDVDMMSLIDSGVAIKNSIDSGGKKRSGRKATTV